MPNFNANPQRWLKDRGTEIGPQDPQVSQNIARKKSLRLKDKGDFITEFPRADKN